jgi:ribonuclease P protein component
LLRINLDKRARHLGRRSRLSLVDVKVISASLFGVSGFMEKKYRLAKREDFNKVYRYGKSAANHQFVLYYLLQPKLECFRLGVSVSKKIGNAVVRNRLRRMMKEIIRLNKEHMASQFDYILIARKPCAEMDYQAMEKSILHVVRKASLAKRDERLKN